jgi:hypothetical protein
MEICGSIPFHEGFKSTIGEIPRYRDKICPEEGIYAGY